mmetsp:Transcript_19166/g.40600  ORF Transcript_19166/g.40600 Transcript_19166/m.40600 type:complete len:276 (-) Transcript_19166:462-1289(-)
MSHVSVTVSSAAVPTNCVVNSSASGYSKSEQKRCDSELSNQLLWMSACTSTESGSSLRRNAAPRVLPTTHPPNANGARDGSSNQTKTEPSVKISATFAAKNSDKPTKRGDSMALPPASYGESFGTLPVRTASRRSTKPCETTSMQPAPAAVLATATQTGRSCRALRGSPRQRPHATPPTSALTMADCSWSERATSSVGGGGRRGSAGSAAASIGLGLRPTTACHASASPRPNELPVFARRCKATRAKPLACSVSSRVSPNVARSSLTSRTSFPVM